MADIHCLKKTLPADEAAEAAAVKAAAEPAELPLTRPIPAVVAVPSTDG
jgi:hypothetical protein